MIADGLYCIAAAPKEAMLTDYDRRHLYTYARLLDAERDGIDWQIAASEILHANVADDPGAAECCWRSHLERARWIVDCGLAEIAHTMAVESGT